VKQFAGFVTDDPSIVLVGRETILRNGEFAGYLTSGGYGYTIGKPIGYGYVRNPSGVTADWLGSGSYELVVANETVKAKIALEPLVDPKMLKIKA
jgi:sarcosine dehydrogenase